MVVVDMEMPENCEKCPIRQEFAINQVFCRLLNKKGIYLKPDLKSRPEVCPIKREVE